MKRTLAAGTVAVACLLGGCTPNGGASSPSTTPSSAQPSSSSTTPTVSVTPTPTAEEQAADAVVRFWLQLDRLASDPQLPLSDLTSVARDQALAQWQRNLTQMRGEGLKQVGAVTVGNPAVTYSESTQTYQVSACVDVSKVNVVDQDGKSVVAPNRAPKTKYTYDVSRSDDKYFVIKDPLQGEPC
jgi:hypothetical protein